MNKLIGYRHMLGLTQEEMAKKFGVSKQAYWMRENNKSSFSDEEKMIVKKLLVPIFPNITIDDIFFS